MKTEMIELNTNMSSTLSIGGEVCQLLGKLAHRGAVVKWSSDTGANMTTCEVHLARGGMKASVVVMPRNVAEKARRDGLLKPCSNSLDWKLSKKGALALRAVRSATQLNTDMAVRSANPANPSCNNGDCNGKKVEQEDSLTRDQETKCAQALINEAESPLGWLRRRKGKDGKPLLSDAQYSAGEQLRADFWLGQMTPRVTANWSAAPAGRLSRRNGARSRGEASDTALNARQRVRRALNVVGPELSGVLIDVCCHLKGLELAERSAGWPLRSGKVVLGLSLSALARHYGMVQEPQKKDGRSRAIGHWGAGDYRPLFDDE